MTYYTDEFRKLKVAQLRALRELKNQGYNVIFKNEMGKFSGLASRWDNEFIGCKIPKYKVDKSLFEILKSKVDIEQVCENCGCTFKAKTHRKYCTTKCIIHDKRKECSICFDCKTYWNCSKSINSLKVNSNMLRYKFVNNNETLSVQECKKYKR